MLIEGGLASIQRRATVSARGAGTAPPCYCGENRGSQPFFPGAYVGFEVYPTAFKGKGALHEGLGLHFEGIATSVGSVVQTTGESFTSNVFALNGGATFRWVLWDASTAVALKFKTGISYFRFPLSQGNFPGVDYTGQGYLGADVDVPLMAGLANLRVGAMYTAVVAAKDDGSGRFGAHDGGSALRGSVAFHINLGPVRAGVLGRFERVDTRYKGAADFQTGEVFQDVEVEDRMFIGMLTGGIAF